MKKRELNVKVVLIVAGIMLLLLGVAAILFVKIKPQDSADGLTGEAVKELATEISVGDNFVPASAPLHIAYSKGYFAGNGLNVSIERFSAGRYSLDALISGNVDAAMVADTPLMLYGLREHDICIIATAAFTNKDIKIIARTDKNILMPTDLKGKKIAVLKGTISEQFLDAFLKKYQVKSSEVIIVNLKPENMPAALIRGDVDAFSGWAPFTYYAQQELKNNTIQFTDSDFIYTWNVVVKKDFVAKNPAAIKKFLKAFKAAEALSRNNKSEFLGLAVDYTGMDPATLSKVINNYEFRVSLDQNLLLSNLKEQARWAKEKGLVPAEYKTPDYSALICPDFLQETLS